MSKKDDDMDIELKERIEEIISELKEAVGIDEEMMGRIERVTTAQHDVGKILMELSENESAMALIGVVASVCISYSDSLDEAISTLAKMQVAALKIISGADENKIAPWHLDDEEENEPDDFPVEHKTKQ